MKQHPRIWVVFHSYGSCPTQFAVDLTKALRYTGTIIPAVIHEPSCYVDSSRNKLVRKFLAEPSSTHMMMVDVDISFDSDAFLKTFTIMTALKADIVYGNYALGNGSNSLFGPPDNKHNEAAVRAKLQPNMIYEDIATGGTGWVLVTKQLLQRMEKECPGPWHWFARDPTFDGKDLRGEDITFGLRAYALNPRPKIIGTTNIVLRHLKNQGYIPDFMMQVAAEEGGSGICMPNPYENDPQKYILLGNSVIDKATLTPEQLAVVEKEVGEWNARKAGEGTQSPSSQEGPKQEEGGSLRVRDVESNRVETQEGEVNAASERAVSEVSTPIA